MNIIDMLAIAPYYVTLFFMPGVNSCFLYSNLANISHKYSNISSCRQIFKYFSAADLEPPTPGAVVEVEEPSAFAGAGKIMQVTQTTTK